MGRNTDDSSNSDEDDGNFKRRQKRGFNDSLPLYESARSSLARKANGGDTVDSIAVTNHKKLKLDAIAANRVYADVDRVEGASLASVHTVSEDQKQTLASKLSTLPTYDDIDDFVVDTSIVSEKFASRLQSASDSSAVKLDPRSKYSKIDNSNATASRVEAEAISMSALSREPDSNVSKTETEASIRHYLAMRNPSEAYKALKFNVVKNKLSQYVDDLTEIALEWFPAFIDKSDSPADCFVDTSYINEFKNVLRDVFYTKTKDADFWEQLVESIDDFIKQTRVREVPQLLSKLRTLLIQDIRDYLISEEIKMNLTSSVIIFEHKSNHEFSRNAERNNHRRKFEESQVSSTTSKIGIVSGAPPPPTPPSIKLAPHFSPPTHSSLVNDPLSLNAPTNGPSLSSISESYMPNKTIKTEPFIHVHKQIPLPMPSLPVITLPPTTAPPFEASPYVPITRSNVKSLSSIPSASISRPRFQIQSFNPSLNRFDEQLIPIKQEIIGYCDYRNGFDDLTINFSEHNIEIPLVLNFGEEISDPRKDFMLKCSKSLSVNLDENFDVIDDNLFSPIPMSDTSLSPASIQELSINISNDILGSVRKEESTQLSVRTQIEIDLSELAQLPAKRQNRLDLSRLANLKSITRTVTVSQDTSSSEEE